MSGPAVPDALADIKVYFESSTFSSVLPGGVFYRLPPNAHELDAPFLNLYRSGGGILVTGGDFPEIQIRVALAVWGNADSQYDAVRAAANKIENELFSIGRGFPVLLNPSGSSVARNAQVTAFPDAPDPDTGWPRMVGDSVWLVRSATP